MIVMPSNWRRSISWVLKVNLAFLGINLLLLLFLSLFLKIKALLLLEGGFLTLMLLLDSGIIFFVGGFIPMFSSIFPSKIREHVFQSDEEWSQEKHRKSQMKGNVYILLGIVLFVESLISGYIIW